MLSHRTTHCLHRIGLEQETRIDRLSPQSDQRTRSLNGNAELNRKAAHPMPGHEMRLGIHILIHYHCQRSKSDYWQRKNQHCQLVTIQPCSLCLRLACWLKGHNAYIPSHSRLSFETMSDHEVDRPYVIRTRATGCKRGCAVNQLYPDNDVW
jgi:hypothetical protein